MIDEALEMGRELHTTLGDHTRRLAQAKGKLSNVVGTIGVSDSLVNFINRRQTFDKWLIQGCMALTLFVLFSLWSLRS